MWRENKYEARRVMKKREYSIKCPKCRKVQKIITKRPSEAVRKCVYCNYKFRIYSPRQSRIVKRIGEKKYGDKGEVEIKRGDKWLK